MKTRCGFRSVRPCVAGGLTLLLILALIQPALTSASERKSAARTGQKLDQQQKGKARKVTPLPPERGAPAANLPSLDETRQRQREEVKAPVPTQSTIRSRRKPGNTTPNKKSHHLRWRANKLRNDIGAKPTPPQGGPSLFTNDPLKNPNDPDSFKIQALHITELRAAINTVRNRRHLPDYSWVKPNASGGAINTNVLISWEPIDEMRTALNQAIGPPPNGYAAGLGLHLPILADHITELRERVKDILGVTTLADQLAPARVDPFNQSGNQIQARDAEWSLPLVSLPGRAGLDLGIGLTYSSMVWTQAGSYISFDDDWGDPSPGFKIGFPAIQGRFTNNLIGTNVYVLITSAGHRAELRRVGTSNIYEAGDSSYLQLIDYGGSLLLRTTDGTQMTYHKFGSDWHCTAIEDRNGNLILTNYNSFGDILDVTDTLGRLFSFNYDGNYNLISITQTWTVSGVSQTHTWATFGWGTVTMHPAFSGVNVVGVFDGEVIPVLTQVGLPDGSHYNFEYNSNGQATAIRRYTDDNPTGTTQGDLQRTYTTYNYDTPAADCPRITAARVWADNWSGVAGVPLEVVTYFADNHDGSHQMTAPDGTVYKEFYGGPGDLPAWQHGLITSTQVLSGGTVQKTTSAAYAQDNLSVNYQTNPRVYQTVVTDGTNNRKTTIGYQTFALPVTNTNCSLPNEVYEYDTDQSTVLRRTHSHYLTDAAYLDNSARGNRIIGLKDETDVYQGVSTLMSKTTYAYDQTVVSSQATTAVGHDQSYDNSSAATVRGNVTTVSRFDVNNSNSTSTSMTYDAAGNLLSTTDASNHTTSIGYVDSFSDANNHNSFAYPTTLTDADGFSSYVQYSFDFSAKTRVLGPPPQGQANGVIQTFSYDEALRVKRVTTLNTGAYVHYDHGPNHTSSFASINSAAPNYWDSDTFTTQFFDGLGRVFAVASNHPGSTGGNKGQYIRYDVMGRAVQQTNPFEMDSGWNPVGDDNAGYQFNVANTFDWKGRPLKSYNMDGTYKEASYAGCGCAGGEVVTLTDEMDRQQKVYSDVLGRQWKTEALNLNGSVYSTRIIAYNARDQIKSVKQYQGLESSGVYQEETETYDGYGRLESRKAPIQTNPTSFTYYANDKPQTMTDARGATTTYTYNNRGLMTGVSFSGPAPVPGAMSYGYDAAGNRTSMSDETGSVTYQYDQLSRLNSETRHFVGSGVPPGYYSFSYDYSLAGQLKVIIDPAGSRVDYGYDNSGRLMSVSGSGPTSAPSYASGFAYRAWGGIKDFDFGNGVHQHLNFNSRLQNTSLALSNVSNGGTMTWTYDYYAESKLSRVTDSAAPNFDRFFDYDHMGRLQNALTGSEARGGTTADGPFKQTYSYDVWENTTSRTGRVWTQPITNGSASYPNNRHQYWSYDNQGNVTATYDANFGYDAAGRQNTFTSNATVGELPALEVAQTFDGNSAPASKTETSRSDPNAPAAVTSTFYLRSTVLGGKVVAEVDSTGYKRVGHIYAGGVEIATQTIWNPGYGSQVTWVSTSPATGSEYRSLGDRSVGRQELDPLGSDVTYPPDPLVLAEEPPFYNPKFDRMPLEYEWGPSQEVQDAMDWWQGQLAITEQAIADRDAAIKAWQAGDRSTALLILQNNPNVGIRTGSGNSNFGNDAASFLGLETAYGADDSSSDIGTHDVSSAYNVSIFGGAETFIEPQNTSATERPLTKEQGNAVWNALELARKVMENRPLCRKYAGAGAYEAMRALWDSGRYTHFQGNQGGANRNTAWAETGLGPGLFDRYRTVLFFGFFNDPMINDKKNNGAAFLDISADQFRATVLMHEVRHYLCPGCKYAEPHDANTWNKDIVKYCFK